MLLPYSQNNKLTTESFPEITCSILGINIFAWLKYNCELDQLGQLQTIFDKSLVNILRVCFDDVQGALPHVTESSRRPPGSD